MPIDLQLKPSGLVCLLMGLHLNLILMNGNKNLFEGDWALQLTA
jgi:hypothetical protein